MSTETETPTTPDPLGDWFRRIGASLTLSRDDYEAGIAAIAAHDREVAARALHDAADELERLIDSQHPVAVNPDAWLRDRAIESGETDA